MPTDLTPWPALLEAVAKRWPDAPKPSTDELEIVTDVRTDELPAIVGVFKLTDGTPVRVTDSVVSDRIIVWAFEVGQFFEDTPDGYGYTVVPRCDRDGNRWGWEVLFAKRKGASGKAPTLLSAHAAAVGAIVGGD